MEKRKPDYYDNLDKTYLPNAIIVYSSPKKLPSSQIKTNLSTSGSTAIPKSAFSETTLEDILFVLPEPLEM